MRKILITLTPQCLLVANTGIPFSNEGVTSVCYTHLSAKSNDSIHVPKTDNIVAKIQQSFVQKWTDYPNDYIKDVNSLSGTSIDYQGREILELLQNCIDAISSHTPIGAKGLGFKAVFNISLTPAIYSGDFNFEFDAGRTQQCLHTHKFKSPADVKTLAMLMPHETTRPAHIRHIMTQGYCTVIECPLVGDMAYNNVKSDLHDIIKNPHFLLFVDDIDEVKIVIDDMETCLNTQVVKQQYHLYTHQENDKHMAIAIPKNHSIPMHKRLISVYFPTTEYMDINAIIHGNFCVSNNRNAIMENQQNFGQWNPLVQQLVKQIINDKNISIIKKLQCFKEYKDYRFIPNIRTFAKYLDQCIAKAYQQIDFIPTYGGGMANITNGYWWNYNDTALQKIITDTHPDIADYKLVCPTIQIPSDLLFNKKTLDDYKHIPFFKMRSGAVRALKCQIPILESLVLPDFVKLGTDYDALVLPDNIERSFIYNILPYDNYTRILNPIIANNFNWFAHGTQLLQFMYNNPHKYIKGAKNVKIPVKGNIKWQHAPLVYAGGNNGGLDIDHILSPDFILTDTPSKYNDFYKRLGVSYGFKVLSDENTNTAHIDKFTEITTHLKTKVPCATLCALISQIKNDCPHIHQQIQTTPFVKVKGTPILQNTEFLAIKDMYIFDNPKYTQLFATPDINNMDDLKPFFETYGIMTHPTHRADDWQKYFATFANQTPPDKINDYKAFYNTCYGCCQQMPHVPMLCTDGVVRPVGDTYYYDTPIVQKQTVQKMLSETYPQAVISTTQQAKFFGVQCISTLFNTTPDIGDIIYPYDILSNIQDAHPYIQKFMTAKLPNENHLLDYAIKIASHITYTIATHTIHDTVYTDNTTKTIYLADTDTEIIATYAHTLNTQYRNDIIRILDLIKHKRHESLKTEFHQWGIDTDTQKGLLDYKYC